MAEPSNTDSAAERAGRSPKLWITIVAVVVLAIFVIQNSQSVEVDFLFTSTDTPLVFALILAGILGAIIGWAAPRIRRH